MKKNKNTKSYICEIIKDRISYYEYKPGDILLEADLMKEFSIGRTPVREAFIELSSLGLIEMVPNHGTFVKKISFGEAIQVYEVRTNLIELSGRLAAQRITEKEIQQIEEILQENKGITDRNSILQIDAKIHVIIDKSTKNDELVNILDTLKIKFLSIWQYPVEDHLYYESIYNDFEMILQSLKDRDPEKCGNLLKEHLKNALSQFKKIL